jgi:cellulose synthase/poly-beta-1,6-N-acetylglucosamine synthase-like glycosyltransferase
MKIELAEILLIVFGAGLCIHLLYYFFFFSRIAFHKKGAVNTHQPPVSVIICARSESAKLMENLPYVFDQDYPDFEVVVVNDRSWDDTKEILKAFQVRFQRLKVIQIEESNHEHYGKKMALTIGIKGASHELLLLTDADCKPASSKWIAQMVEKHLDGKEVVLGYSPYQRKKKSMLNRIIRFDTFWAGMHYLSFAKAGLPYMGVGRNLMYEKKTFFRVSGFKKHYHISSGDDDLFVKEVGTRKNTAVCIHPEAHTLSSPKETFTDWFRQKKRHFTTAPHYKLKHKLLLSFYSLALILLLSSTIGLIVLNKYLLIILRAWFFRLLLQMVIFSRSMKLLGDKDLLIWSPLLEWIIFIIHPVIHISNRFVKADKWN